MAIDTVDYIARLREMGIDPYDVDMPQSLPEMWRPPKVPASRLDLSSPQTPEYPRMAGATAPADPIGTMRLNPALLPRSPARGVDNTEMALKPPQRPGNGLVGQSGGDLQSRMRLLSDFKAKKSEEDSRVNRATGDDMWKGIARIMGSISDAGLGTPGKTAGQFADNDPTSRASRLAQEALANMMGKPVESYMKYSYANIAKTFPMVAQSVAAMDRDAKMANDAESKKRSLEESKKRADLSARLMAQSYRNEEDARKAYQGDPTVMPTYNSAMQYNSMVQLAGKDKPTGMDDMALIYAFNKVIDPPAVVRESDVDNVKSAIGKVPAFSQQIESLLQGKGNSLTPDARIALVQAAKDMLNEKIAGQLQVDQQFYSRIKDSGLNPANVLHNWDTIIKKPMIDKSSKYQAWSNTKNDWVPIDEKKYNELSKEPKKYSVRVVQ